MNFYKSIGVLLLMFVSNAITFAQFSKSVSDVEIQYKDCKKINPDSSGCSRTYLAQLDSLQLLITNELNKQLIADEKSTFEKEQISWSKKKAAYFKKLDETFVYNLQEGIWKKEMIRITYEQKAAFILKRINMLLKKLKE